MANDPNALPVTINYEGGYIVMPAGNAKDLFGDDPSVLRPEGKTKAVSVKEHQRTRVIGGPSRTVPRYDYEYTVWPSRTSAQAAGGEAIEMNWEGSEGWWTARMGGSAWELGKFLNEKSPKAVSFQTRQGTLYGPFIKSAS